MCVIIDACAIHCVFGANTECHDKFKAILDWIQHRDGKIIYGGRKYKKELNDAIGKYSRLFKELQKNRKIIILDDARVDARERELQKRRKPTKALNDHHLVAIVIESGCKIVCTNEIRAIPLLKDLSLYPSSRMRPKIYNQKSHASMIYNKKNTATICESP